MHVFMPMEWDNSNNVLKNADFNFMIESSLMQKKNLMLQKREKIELTEREKGDGMREREISDVISDYKGNSHTIIK